MFRTLLAVILALAFSAAGAQIVNRPVAANAVAAPATSAPSTCAVGGLFFKSNATAGQNLQLCTAANTWTSMTAGGAAGAFTTLNLTGALTGTTAAFTKASQGDVATFTNGGATPKIAYIYSGPQYIAFGDTPTLGGSHWYIDSTNNTANVQANNVTTQTWTSSSSTMIKPMLINVSGAVSSLTMGSNAASGFSTVVMQGNGSQTNWLIGSSNNLASTLEFTPSTATGGATFSNPALTLTTSLNTSKLPLLISTGTTANQVRTAQTTVPTCTTNCGTGSPTVAGTDTAGIITLGTTPASAFQVNFNGTWAAAPSCIVQSALATMVVGKMPIAVVTTTTTMTVTTNGTAPATSDKYQYHCIGVS